MNTSIEYTTHSEKMNPCSSSSKKKAHSSTTRAEAKLSYV